MPITNRPDPNYQPEEFQTFSDGKYTVSGINWFTVDEEGAPIFVVQSNSTALVARYRTVIGDNEGPPGSVSPGEIPLLVKAFGADPSKLPSRDDPTAYLIAARDLINAKERSVQVEVANQWVSRIPGMTLPVDQYFRFRVVRITTRNESEEPCWKDGNWGKYFGIEFEVVGDMMGNRTPYDGARIWESISYGLTVDSATGQPAFTKKDDGNPTPAASQTDRFLSAFCPGVYDAGFENASNILPEFWELYKKDRQVAVTQVVMVGRQNKRVGLNTYGFATVGSVEGGTSEELPDRNVEDEVKEGPIMEQIYAAIAKNAGSGAFDTDGSLSKVGKTWCREHLAPFLQEKNWPKRFDLWTPEQQKAVLEHLTGAGEKDDESEDF